MVAGEPKLKMLTRSSCGGGNLIVVDQFSHAWAEGEEVGWEEGRGREEAARVAEQAW